jgi:O-acetyl-ADP-ribose deacetylase (regulator of RNase III)
MELELILVDPHHGVCDAWRAAFAGLPRVEIIHGVFEDIADYDCMVSPANAFGLMDGGVDQAITDYFGDQLQRRVQAHIIEHYRGEQPLGTSQIIATDHPRHPWLAHTPTMRVPMAIVQTQNVYNAMWAMLLAVAAHNRTPAAPIRRIVCPGLGTGVGQMRFDEAARQMACAYRLFLEPPASLDWRYAMRRHRAISGDRRPGE